MKRKTEQGKRKVSTTIRLPSYYLSYNKETLSIYMNIKYNIDNTIYNCIKYA